MSDPTFWDNPDKAREISQEATQLKNSVEGYKQLVSDIEDASVMLDMAIEEEDTSMEGEIKQFVNGIQEAVEKQEVLLLLGGEYDQNNAILTFHAGAGGTEAQDWCSMLIRMYLRWAEKTGFSVELMDEQPGDEAGIKSATFLIKGENAFGYLKSEKGVHRLVRISPFDAAARRHTSFAAVDVMPEIDDTVEINIDMKDVQVDTYRASGAGGQHINKTDSAVRIVHKPTGIVVKCQDGRSQHENRATALMTIRSRVYEEHQRKLEEEQGIERRNKIGTGDRAEKIRTYNYPQNRVTDHRIGYTVNQLDRIMEGRMQDLLDALLSADQQAKLAGEK